jgi:branched-chain amino acid transport system ATP-binding protein
MSATPSLKIVNISKRFSGLKALENVGFDVAEGSIAGIMGANGAGKTTLFSIIAGNNTPDSGEILLKGRSLVGKRPDQVCREGIARTFQIVRPFGGLTVLENVVTAAIFGSHQNAGRNEAIETAIRVLQEVDLIEQRNAKAAELTLSNQKRLEVARAVATGPTVLLLDEVMAGLTAVEVNRMLEIIENLKRSRNLTILVIEHVMQALMRLSDKIIVLDLGEVVAEGTPDQIRINPKVHEIYFGKAI